MSGARPPGAVTPNQSSGAATSNRTGRRSWKRLPVGWSGLRRDRGGRRLVVPCLERLFQLAPTDRAEHELEQPSLEVLALADDDVVDVGRPVGIARERVRVARG